MNIDIEEIKAILDIYGILIPEFVKYGEIYLNTTENISGIMSKINLKDKSVLSVAGSGDQALNAYLNGAKSVTLFDINPLAFAQTELKLAGARRLSFEEFCEYFIPGCGNLLNCHTFLKLSDFLKEDAAIYYDYLYSKYTPSEIFDKTFRPFQTGITKLETMNDYLNKDNFKKLPIILEDKEIKYIETNLLDLPDKLEEMFDAILLSNISDSIEKIWDTNTLKNYKRFIHVLSKNLNKGGFIQCGYVYSSYKSQARNPLFANKVERQKVFTNDEFKEWGVETFVRFSAFDDTVIAYEKKRRKVA